MTISSFGENLFQSIRSQTAEMNICSTRRFITFNYEFFIIIYSFFLYEQGTVLFVSILLIGQPSFLRSSKTARNWNSWCVNSLKRETSISTQVTYVTKLLIHCVNSLKRETSISTNDAKNWKEKHRKGVNSLKRETSISTSTRANERWRL